MKLKKIIAIMLSSILMISNYSMVFGDVAPIAVDAKSAVLMEPSTGKIIIDQNKDEKLPLASVTKVMTLLLIYQAIDDGKIKWEDTVTVSQHAASMGGSQVFLEAMEQQSVRDLVKCIEISSANDAAVAMAEYIAGSEDGFVTLMNNEAKNLGMVNSHFVNACGLDEANHYSSAYDIAIMTRELITKHPQVLEFSKVWQDTIIHKTAKGESEFGLTNTNKLIKSYDGATGLKTGSTADALYCLSGTAQRDGVEMIAVILGAPDPNTRFHEVIKLFDHGFANYTTAKGLEKDTVVGQIDVYKGSAEKLEVVVKNPINLVVGKGSNRKLEHKIEIEKSLNAPVTKGIKAGEIIYTFEGNEVGRADLVTKEGTEKISLTEMMNRLIVKWFD